MQPPARLRPFLCHTGCHRAALPSSPRQPASHLSAPFPSLPFHCGLTAGMAKDGTWDNYAYGAPAPSAGGALSSGSDLEMWPAAGNDAWFLSEYDVGAGGVDSRGGRGGGGDMGAAMGAAVGDPNFGFDQLKSEDWSDQLVREVSAGGAAPPSENYTPHFGWQFCSVKQWSECSQLGGVHCAHIGMCAWPCLCTCPSSHPRLIPCPASPPHTLFALPPQPARQQPPPAPARTHPHTLDILLGPPPRSLPARWARATASAASSASGTAPQACST